MLDLKIANIDSIKTKKELRRIFNQRVFVTEKFDGTKLTITRNNEKFDPTDYSKNWIISYKGNIIFKEELKTKHKMAKIRENSIDLLQYKIIHNHLSRVHKNLNSVEPSTEFFIEFIQRKPTLTRQYQKLHDMYLVGFANVNFQVDGFYYHSKPVFTKDITERIDYEYFCRLLKINSLPILYEGYLHHNRKNIKNSLKNLKDVFLNFESSCGGTPEGAVIVETISPKMWKIVQDNQYDKNVRKEIKKKWQENDELKENEYWQKIEKIALSIIPQLNLSNDIPKTLEKMRNLIENMKINIQHSKKELINIEEDIYLKTKMIYMLKKRIGLNTTKVGLIAMAAKPLHAGHWEIINTALSDCEKVFLFLSVKGRKKNNEFDLSEEVAKELITIYEENLPHEIEIIRSNSPIGELKKFLRTFEIAPSFLENLNIYKSEKDEEFLIGSDLKKNNANILTLPINIQISGSEMRNRVLMNQREEFLNFLPNIFTKETKNQIWEILKTAK